LIYLEWLDVIFPKADVKTVFKKILTDQFVISPIFISTYFYSTGYLERQPLPDIHKEFHNKFLTVYTVSDLKCNVLCENAAATIFNFF
jgi:hypothetical protein